MIDSRASLPEIHTCPDCDGSGSIPVLYSQMQGPRGGSNEEAQRLAGEVHHHEICTSCIGSGMVLLHADGEAEDITEARAAEMVARGEAVSRI